MRSTGIHHRPKLEIAKLRNCETAALPVARSISVSIRVRGMRGIEDKRSPGGGGGMRVGAGAMDAGGAAGGGGKRGDACLAEIQRLEKNRANRRNRMEKARYDIYVNNKTFFVVCFR